LSLMAIINPC